MLVADQLEKQRGLCPICTFPLFEQYAVLDRFNRIGNFTPSNVRALMSIVRHWCCHRRAAGRTASAVIEAAESPSKRRKQCAEWVSSGLKTDADSALVHLIGMSAGARSRHRAAGD